MANPTYDQIMQKYVNAPYDVLLTVANDSLSEVMPYFNGVDDDGNGANIVLPFICTALAVDGRFSELEYKFVCDVTGIQTTYDEFKVFVNSFYTPKWIEAIDNMIDACPEEIKHSLLSFCLAFLAVDETITREENAFIYRLIC